MKNLKFTLIIIAVACFSLTAAAQKVRIVITPNDTTVYINNGTETERYTSKTAYNKYKAYKKRTKWRWDQGKFAGFNLFYNGLISASNTMSPISSGDMQLSNKAIGVDINLIDFVIFSHKGFGIVSGLGLESNNFRFQRNISLTKDEAGATVIDNSYNDRNIHLTKSKLTTTYLNVPLLFQFRFDKINRANKGWFSIGVVGGLRLQSYTKVKAPEIGKVKKFDDFNLQNFHYGFLCSIGFSNFSINAKYYPHSIFNRGYGPDLQQFNVGLGITF